MKKYEEITEKSTRVTGEHEKEYPMKSTRNAEGLLDIPSLRREWFEEMEPKPLDTLSLNT